MHVNLHTATAGSFTNEVFDLIIEGTDIKSEKVREALRSHLVYGTAPKRAYESNGVLAPAFSVRLKRFSDEVERLKRIITLCGPQTTQASLAAALREVDDLAATLRKKVGTAVDMASGKV